MVVPNIHNLVCLVSESLYPIFHHDPNSQEELINEQLNHNLRVLKETCGQRVWSNDQLS